MMKKISALLTALSCMASLVALPASAETDFVWEYVKSETGELEVITAKGTYGLIVKTDGTEMTLDTLVPFGYVDTKGMMMSDIDIMDVYKMEEFSRRFSNDTVELMVTEDFDYVIRGEYMTNDELYALGRKLMLELEFVKDVEIMSYESRNTKPDFQLRFSAELVSENTVIDTSTIPELADFTFSHRPNTNIGTFYMDYDAVECYLGNEEYPEFIQKFDLATKDATSYEKYEYLKFYADCIQEKYNDLFTSFTPEIPFMALGGSYAPNTFRIWDTAGDSNTDGAVDASDAAEVLTIAAQNGTGAGIKATSANDVNADGNVDASDAAAVLCYAAAQGTGAEVSWVDILRK